MRTTIIICLLLGFLLHRRAPISLGTRIVNIAESKDIDPALLMALIDHESGFNPNAGRFEPSLYERWHNRDKATSWGLTQVVLGFHSKDCNVETVKELLNPTTNIECGASILKKCMESNSTLKGALSCYNGDRTGVYAKKVLQKYQMYAFNTRLK